MNDSTCCDIIEDLVDIYYSLHQLDSTFLFLIRKNLPSHIKNRLVNEFFRESMTAAITHLAHTATELLMESTLCIQCQSCRQIFLEKFWNVRLNTYLSQ